MGIFIIILTFIAGAVLATQAPINAAFANKAGSLESAFLNFFLGTIIMIIVVILFGKMDLLAISEAPTWQLLCAFCSLAYVVLSIISVPKIGVGAAVITVIVGQIVTSMVIDNFGFFGNLVILFDLKRLVGVILMFVALYFMMKNKSDKDRVSDVKGGV